jgi:hypothetical protein
VPLSTRYVGVLGNVADPRTTLLCSYPMALGVLLTEARVTHQIYPVLLSNSAPEEDVP